MKTTAEHDYRVAKLTFASVYPHYLAKDVASGPFQFISGIANSRIRILDVAMPAGTACAGRLTWIFIIGSLASIVVFSRCATADGIGSETPLPREVIVSHTDDQGVLQLFRVNEDGTQRRQLTDLDGGCRMPACSPDGKEMVYVRQMGNSLSLWLSGIDGEDARPLTTKGMNLLPSWLPDSKHIVWMEAQPSAVKQDPARNSQLRLINTETGESRRLFSDPEQLKYSNAMPSVSPDGKQIAFVSNRSGLSRVWVSRLDGSDAKMVSRPPSARDETLDLPIEQKVPVWSPDGKSIAHWEGVEMIHMSPFTGIHDPQRDRLISETFHVWVVESDGGRRRKVGRGDDPTWSPDGFVTRAFPDPERGGPKVVIQTNDGEKMIPIVPRNRNWGRFTWLRVEAQTDIERSGPLEQTVDR